MRIYLQTQPNSDGNPRYFHIFIQEDLINGWTLVKENGIQGSSGKVTKTHYNDHDQALTALIKTRDSQLKRGYHVVFMRGEKAPA